MLRKYAAALLPAIIILLGALQTALADNTISRVEASQLIVLVAGVVATYFVPLAKGAWAGALKTSMAILAAIATLLVALIIDFTWQALIIVALAGLQVLATEIGVHVRTDAPHSLDPVSNGLGTLPRA